MANTNPTAYRMGRAAVERLATVIDLANRRERSDLVSLCARQIELLDKTVRGRLAAAESELADSPLYNADYSTVRALKAAVREHGAGEAELAAIDRFDNFTATRVDVDRLAPLAALAGLPWAELFPADK